jgi:hypothetical protein
MGCCESEEEDEKNSSSCHGRQVFPDKVAALQRFEFRHGAKRMGVEASTRDAGGVDKNRVDLNFLERRQLNGLLGCKYRRIRI